MNIRNGFFVAALVWFAAGSAFAQSDFNLDAYYQFLSEHADMDACDIQELYPTQTPYWTELGYTGPLEDYKYLDSIRIKFELTDDELAALQERHFVVTERLSYGSMGDALIDVFYHDLPVFISTDAVLQALHRSYDVILQSLEYSLLYTDLQTALQAMYDTYPQLMSEYQDQPGMASPLEDIDLYITMALSLLEGELLDPQNVSYDFVEQYWNAVQAELLVSMPLFSDAPRDLDFSQFTPRGHYDDWGGSLSRYFKTMMWLGRMDFLLANPPGFVTESDVRRMNIDSILLLELIDLAAARDPLEEVDEVIEFMVGESDNLTMSELRGIMAEQGIDGADALLADATYASFQDAVAHSPLAEQKILSSIIMYDWEEEPPPLPVSFRLLGQRFVIDSYVFARVVFPNIRYQGTNFWRPMPDPLDAMFALGNEDAIQLMEEELEEYHYATALAGMRYLVDACDDEFWSNSLYNIWLNSIRALNPPADSSNLPLFMQTTGWHQQKLNTQLASWAQLRHDNLLYAKQSYTGGFTCYYPCGYVEPYPEFYGNLRQFAEQAGAYFGGLGDEGNWGLSSIVKYFNRFASLTDTLETLANKELSGTPFDENEEEFLKRVLTSVYTEGFCGITPADGWYVEMFYGFDLGESSKSAYDADYVIADVHTQPTDEFGAPVGKVLHVGVGDVNLGIYLVEQTHSDVPRCAYVGPAMSYYEVTTGGFDRLTDERWAEDYLFTGDTPPRPDWVNVYLADATGTMYEPGRELDGGVYTSVPGVGPELPAVFSLSPNYPNPFNPQTVIRYSLPQAATVQLTIYDVLGREVANLVSGQMAAGAHEAMWTGRDRFGGVCPSGVYIYQLRAGDHVSSRRMLLLK